MAQFSLKRLMLALTCAPTTFVVVRKLWRICLEDDPQDIVAAILAVP